MNAFENSTPISSGLLFANSQSSTQPSHSPTSESLLETGWRNSAAIVQDNTASESTTNGESASVGQKLGQKKSQSRTTT